ncbi:hypothetical protein Ddc_21285 [Ditylenchus destructor]|nr:hypothetical protein Ddc_21285 [Ditylenchus destructor]
MLPAYAASRPSTPSGKGTAFSRAAQPAEQDPRRPRQCRVERAVQPGGGGAARRTLRASSGGDGVRDGWHRCGHRRRHRRRRGRLSAPPEPQARRRSAPSQARAHRRAVHRHRHAGHGRRHGDLDRRLRREGRGSGTRRCRAPDHRTGARIRDRRSHDRRPLAQGMAGVCNFRLHRAEHRQLKADLNAARGMSAHLPPAAFGLYEDDASFRLADSARDQVFDAMLTAGQGLMLGASVSSFACPPVAAALAAPGALLTIGASIGAGVNEKHRADFLGDQAPEAAKSRMRSGNLGPRLRDHALGAVLRDVAGSFQGHQEQLARTRLWNDLLEVLKEEDALDECSSRPAAERHRRLVERTERRKGAAHLLPVGVERLRVLRDAHYPLPRLEASTAVLHERLAQELRAHPASDAITAQPSFQRDVLFATAQDLARRNRPDTRALFFDARGQRKPTLTADAQFFDFLDGNEAARTVYLQHHNEALARALTPTDRFGRADSRDALTDLAHVMRERALRQRP